MGKRGRKRTQSRKEKRLTKRTEKVGFGVVAIIGAIICGIIAMGEFSQLRYSSRLLIDAIISALQTILFVSSVLFRKGVIKIPDTIASDNSYLSRFNFNNPVC